MKTFVLAISSLLILASLVIAQNTTTPAVDPADDVLANPSKPVLLSAPSQCLYDNAKHRVNNDCLVATMPPTCKTGNLVSTTNGKDYEMCCCDYSNFVVATNVK